MGARTDDVLPLHAIKPRLEQRHRVQRLRRAPRRRRAGPLAPPPLARGRIRSPLAPCQRLLPRQRRALAPVHQAPRVEPRVDAARGPAPDPVRAADRPRRDEHRVLAAAVRLGRVRDAAPARRERALVAAAVGGAAAELDARDVLDLEHVGAEVRDRHAREVRVERARRLLAAHRQADEQQQPRLAGQHRRRAPAPAPVQGDEQRDEVGDEQRPHLQRAHEAHGDRKANAARSV